jgi:hypothetical protein
MHRLPLAVARFLFVIAIGAIATVLGVLLALGGTEAGKHLLARIFTDQSARLVRGSISIHRIEGNFFTWLNLDSVVVRDTTGFPLASLGRVEARFRLPELLAGRIVFERVLLVRPRFYLVHRRGGRLNLEEVLRLGEGPDEGGPGSLVELRNVTIRDGIVSLRTPWSPPGHLTTDAQRDSALHAQRTTAGKRIEPTMEGEGLQQVRTIENFYADLPLMRLSTPDRQPMLIRIDSLRMDLNDPLLEVRNLAGELRQARDTLWFELAHAAFPNTEGTARGLVSWPRDTLLFDFRFDAERMALADLRFVSPDFPDLVGSGNLRARSQGGLLTEYGITNLDAHDSAQRITGDLVALAHRLRGLGFRDLDLRLDNVDLEVVRPYLDTLPFRGRLSGRLEADGYFDDMRVVVDWSFFDDRVPGQPVNLVRMRGPIRLGGAEGIVFRQVEVDTLDLDLPTVRLAAPAVILEGRAGGSGQLDGPWKNVTYTGRIAHWDGARPVTRAEGRVRLDTRSEMVAVDADLDFMPFEFEGVRRSFPTLTALGSVSGPVQLVGPLDSMSVQADLQGALGRVRADGLVSMLPPRWSADSLLLDFNDLDLAQLRGSGPATLLSGRMRLAGVIDSAVAPDGTVVLDLTHGWIREVEVDSVYARIAVRDSMIQVDTAAVHLPRVEGHAQGTLGWVSPKSGTLDLMVGAERLLVFDSLLNTLMGVEPDTTGQAAPLDGTLAIRVTLRGALDSLETEAGGSGTDLRWRDISIPNVDGRATITRHSPPVYDIQVRADSVYFGRRSFTDLSFLANGRIDSLHWQAAGAGGPLIQARGGGLLARGDSTRLGFDSLEVQVRDRVWAPRSGFALTLGDSAWSFPEVWFETRDGSAQLRLDGTLPGRGPGELDLTLSGLDLRDVYAVIQRDTSLIRGLLAMDLRIAGTAADPLIRGTGNLTAPVFGDFRAPLTHIALNYARRRLDANLTLWRTGSSLMEIGATLPLDLSWAGEREGSRQLPGQLAIRARADSMNLAVAEAFTQNLRQVRGFLTADVAVQGTWDAPRLAGAVEVREGTALVPDLGVRYGPFNGRIRLTGDSLVIDTVEVGGREGRLVATGHLRLENLTRPVLGLDIQAFDFVVMDVPDYLRIQADGQVRLRGPVARATMTGSATMRNSVVYFADLVQKSIVNLEDPLFADLVDSATIRRRGLGAAFQSRFLDSLRIQDFQFRAAEGVWLRSNEANIQLEGGVTVQKNRNLYRLDGAFTAVRGTYDLKLLAITRSFEVTRGEVKYFGEPDLNADLDIQARHTLPPVGPEGTTRDIEVTATISGTLRRPRLSLMSNIYPPLSQSDLISLLIFRRPVNQVVAGQSGAADANLAGSLVLQTVASELGRLLRGESQVGVDFIEIRPGESYASGQASLTRLSAGWQLGDRWFVSLITGICRDFQQFDYRNFGASLDYRLGGHASASVSAEPYQTCLASTSAVGTKRYQFGADLRWGREY